MSPRKASDLTVTDQFCGAGGSSLGAVAAGARVRMALNHWKRAIETHNTNFPDTDHDCTDISACDPRRYPSTDVLITSPECTTHSPAGGGTYKRPTAQLDAFRPAPVDPAAERSRATMWDVWRFAEYHGYRAIIVENVVEARRWPLWEAWWKAGELLGYRGRCVYVNSMHAHPTPQSRDRMYVVWWKAKNRAPDLDIRPAAHCGRCAQDVRAVQAWKPGRTAGKYRKQYAYACPRCATVVEPYYYAALNALDLSLPAERIGDRTRPLSETTMGRIAWGLERFGRTALAVSTTNPQVAAGRGHEKRGRVRAVAAEPMLTQTGSAHAGLAVPAPWLVSTSYFDQRTIPADAAPGPTMTSAPGKWGVAVAAPLLVNTRQQTGAPSHRVRSALDAAGTQSATGHDHGVAFLTTAGSRHTAPADVREAAPTMTGTERLGVVTGAKVMTLRNDRGGLLHSDLTDPLRSQTTATQAALVQRSPFLLQYYGQRQGSEITDAVPTVTTLERHALVGQFAEQERRVEDLYFRMLATHEIQATMAFPDAYVVTGTKREQVKQLGNAVTPPAMQELLVRVLASLAPELAGSGLAEFVA